MTQLQELVVPLKLDNSNFQSGIENSISKATAFGTVIGNLATSAISGAFNLLGKGIQTVTGFLEDSVSEAMASQDAISQLEAVLKSTGGVAGVTSKQAQDLASSYQKVTKFSDEAVLSAESMLLTFTSIGKKVFPQATETILDMSQALGQDLKSSAIQLGKALNDPITGVTALRRVGVQFNDEQEKTIKKLVESGKLEEAQTLILRELQTEFGGSAKAAGATFGGQLEILKNKLSDVKENIGNALLPTLSTLATKFSELIDTPEFKKAVDFVITKLGEIGNWIIDEGIPNFIEFSKKVKEAFDKDGLKGVFDTIDEDLSKAIDNIDWESLGTKFGDWLEKALTNGAGEVDVPKAFEALDKGVTDFFVNAIGKQNLEQWKKLFTMEGSQDFVAFQLNQIIGVIKSKLTEATNAFVKWVGDVRNSVGRFEQDVNSNIATALNNLYTTVSEKLRTIAKEFFTRALGWTQQMKAGFDNGKGGLLSSLSKLVESINGILTKIITSFKIDVKLPSWLGGGSTGSVGTTTMTKTTTNKGNKGRASGGPVIAGQSYNVAEFYKPEVFTPNTSGRIDKKEESKVTVDIDYNRLANVLAVELAKVTN